MALLNGKQIKDTTVALDKLNGSGLVAITGTMSFGATSSLTFAKVPVNGTDVTNKTYVDGQFTNAVESAYSSTQQTNAALSVEVARAIAAEGALAASVDSLELALSAEIVSTNSDVTRIDGVNTTQSSSIDSLELALSAEIFATNSDFTVVNLSVDSVEARLLVEEGRVDAILAASDADKNTFVEIVSLINAVDTTNDAAFASYALATDASVDSLELALSAEIFATNSDVTRIDGVNTTQGASIDSLELALSAEIVATNADITSVDTRVSAIEAGVIAVSVTEDDFKMDTFTGAGLTYTLTSAPAVNNERVVTAFVNGLFAPITSVTDGVVVLGVSYSVDSSDSVTIKYIVD